MTHVIQTQGLYKSLGGQQVLNGIDLTVPSASITALLGNNGAGKSTLFKILTGLISADNGQIEVLGQEIQSGFPNLHKQLGVLVDAPVFYPNLKAREFLTIACKLKGVKTNEIDRVLKIVDLEHEKNRLIKHFSLGMKQRLALAFALIGEPKLLLLDEPTNGLDPQGMQEMRELLTTLPKSTGCSIFVSSHLLDEVEKIAKNVALLHDGVIQVQAEMSDIYASLERTFVLDVGNSQEVVNYLRGQGLAVKQLEQQTIGISGISQQRASELLCHCVQSHWPVYQAYWRQMTLEQWFLHTCNKENSPSKQIPLLQEQAYAVA